MISYIPDPIIDTQSLWFNQIVSIFKKKKKKQKKNSMTSNYRW